MQVKFVRSPAQTDPATHAECLGFIRAAIATADRATARDIAAVVKEVCQNGYADRADAEANSYTAVRISERV